METLIKDDAIFAKAHHAYKKFIQNDALKEIYEARLKWIRDHNGLVYRAEEAEQRAQKAQNRINVLEHEMAELKAMLKNPEPKKY